MADEREIMSDTPKLCRKKLHDLSLPGSVIVGKQGQLGCRECNRDRQRKWWQSRYRFCKARQAARAQGIQLTEEVYYAQSRQLTERSTSGASGGNLSRVAESAERANDGA
jgi:hypothetical protein